MDKLLGAINYLLARLKEPSTYSAITGLAVLAHINLDPNTIQDGVTALGVLAGTAGFFIKESKPLN